PPVPAACCRSLFRREPRRESCSSCRPLPAPEPTKRHFRWKIPPASLRRRISAGASKVAELRGAAIRRDRAAQDTTVTPSAAATRSETSRAGTEGYLSTCREAALRQCGFLRHARMPAEARAPRSLRARSARWKNRAGTLRAIEL